MAGLQNTVRRRMGVARPGPGTPMPAPYFPCTSPSPAPHPHPFPDTSPHACPELFLKTSALLPALSSWLKKTQLLPAHFGKPHHHHINFKKINLKHPCPSGRHTIHEFSEHVVEHQDAHPPRGPFLRPATYPWASLRQCLCGKGSKASSKSPTSMHFATKMSEAQTRGR